MEKDRAYYRAVEQTLTLADFERGKHSPEHSFFHLERMRLLCALLGNPHLGVPSVHIAGTKGKGTTAAMITAILGSAGYKVGLATSPHLHSLTERIRIGPEPISKNDFTNLVKQIWPVVLEAGQNSQYGEVTWFEFMVSAAFHFFRESNVDFQVVETGLGGRLDATNILLPIVSVITSISLDHVNILGDTLAKIASEKAGIIKDEIPVIISPQHWESMNVMTEIAADCNAPVKKVSDDYSVDVKNKDLSGQYLHVRTPLRNYEFKLPLLGIHQTENALTAICAIETLKQSGYLIDDDSVEVGLSKVCWPGRFEVLETSGPTLIVDGAHNPYSMERLVETVNDHMDNCKVIIVFGAIGGHDIVNMLEPLKSLNPVLIPVSSRHPKAIGAEIVRIASANCDIVTTKAYGSVSEGLDHAFSLAGQSDLILGTGSLSVVAEVSEVIKEIPPEIYPNLP